MTSEIGIYDAPRQVWMTSQGNWRGKVKSEWREADLADLRKSFRIPFHKHKSPLWFSFSSTRYARKTKMPKTASQPLHHWFHKEARQLKHFFAVFFMFVFVLTAVWETAITILVQEIEHFWSISRRTSEPRRSQQKVQALKIYLCTILIKFSKLENCMGKTCFIQGFFFKVRKAQIYLTPRYLRHTFWNVAASKCPGKMNRSVQDLFETFSIQFWFF